MTNTVADERRRLRDRLVQLDDERSKIEYALSVLDRIEPEVLASGAGTTRTTRTTRPRMDSGAGAVTAARPGGTFERAVRVINSSERTWRVEELIGAMREDGWTARVESEAETVRSALSRAVRDGLISRWSHGVYGPIMRSVSDQAGSREDLASASVTGPTVPTGDEVPDGAERGTDSEPAMEVAPSPAVPTLAGPS